MKFVSYAVFTIALLLTIHDSLQLENLINTPIHRCILCLCHARTGCYRRTNCASYSISYDYWAQAGSPTLKITDPVNRKSYNDCMRDENCILNTIKLYADGYDGADCNCDAVSDCRDMFMLHLHGEGCKQNISQTYRNRYNNCASNHGLSLLDTTNRCIPNAV